MFYVCLWLWVVGALLMSAHTAKESDGLARLGMVVLWPVVVPLLIVLGWWVQRFGPRCNATDVNNVQGVPYGRCNLPKGHAGYHTEVRDGRVWAQWRVDARRGNVRPIR